MWVRLIEIDELVTASSLVEASDYLLDLLKTAIPSVLPCVFSGQLDEDTIVFTLNNSPSNLNLTLITNAQNRYFQIVLNSGVSGIPNATLFSGINFVATSTPNMRISFVLDGVVKDTSLRLRFVPRIQSTTAVTTPVVSFVPISEGFLHGNHWFVIPQNENFYNVANILPIAFAGEPAINEQNVFKAPSMILSGSKQIGVVPNAVITSNLGVNIGQFVKLDDGIYIVVASRGSATFGSSLLIKV
jgi:hypothetical protein